VPTLFPMGECSVHLGCLLLCVPWMAGMDSLLCPCATYIFANVQVHQLQATYPLLAANGDRAVFFAKNLQDQSAAASSMHSGQSQRGLDLAEDANAPSCETKAERCPQHRPHTRFHLTFRLWGWAGKQLLHKATFGLI